MILHVFFVTISIIILFVLQFAYTIVHAIQCTAIYNILCIIEINYCLVTATVYQVVVEEASSKGEDANIISAA